MGPARVVATPDTVSLVGPGHRRPAPCRPRSACAQSVDGNNVILDLGNGVWAMRAHFQKCSILVKPGGCGEEGRSARKLGNTGNTGNANAPHVHSS